MVRTLHDICATDPSRIGLDTKSLKKFVATFGLLKSDVSPYSTRFLNLWEKSPSGSGRSEVILDIRKRGEIGSVEAWKALVAYSFATGRPATWRADMPAVATHWLEGDDEQRGRLVSAGDSQRWEEVLSLLCRADGKAKVTKSNLYPLRSRLQKPKFKFIDLFAGIGGFRIPLQSQGGECVFSSEWDAKARETYYQNYGKWPFGDITFFTGDHSEVSIPEFIPDHDILAAGFPCQPFSQAGQKLGFDDARGTLFFDILKIAKQRRPKVLFLENVKGLRGHDKGQTFRVICDSLHDIGYKVYSKVLSAREFGVPQNRQRIFIVAFSSPLKFKFPKSVSLDSRKSLKDILEPKPEPRFTISDRMWAGHQTRKKRHRANGNGYGYSLFKKDAEYVNTISARYWKDGSEILIDQGRRNPRTLTPRECARLQGFPEEFSLHPSKKSNYQQFGNSVAVPVIDAITREIIRSLTSNVKAVEMFDDLRTVDC